MIPPLVPSALRLVLLAALVASVGLAGCGRRGPLELPPSAQLTDRGDGKPKEAQAVTSEDGRLVAPPGPKRRFILDGLLN